LARPHRILDRKLKVVTEISTVGVVQRCGRTVLNTLSTLGEVLLLLGRSIPGPRSLWRERTRIVEQMIIVGSETLPIASLVAFFIGMVLVVQTADQLVNYSQEVLGSIVGLSMTKELGPVLIAFLVAGRVGSSITAQIGSMAVYDEVSALRTMDIDPERYLVTPRIIAMALSLPVLILYADAVGILGGCLAVQLDPAIDISLALFWDNLVSEIAMQDIVVGLVKGVVFGVTIAAVSCAFGLRTRGGTAGVASSTTQSVVWSFVLVIMFDFIIVRMAVLLP